MPDFIYRANIDHFLGLLNVPGLAPDKRATIVKLLVTEEDRLSHYQEQLEFAESRAAKGRERLNDLRQKLETIDPSAAHRATTEKLVQTVEATQQLLDGFCHHLRSRLHSRL